MSFRRLAFSALATLGLGSLFFSGCSTDLDPNADYKEITVIYSLLNPAESIHYVKVTKAFQNNNADARNIAATQPDSMYYPAEDLQVKLQKLKSDSSVLAEYPLVRIDTTGKEAGTFFSGHQVLYRTSSLSLDQNAIYRVVATNTRTGNVARAATNIIDAGRFCVFQVSRKPAPPQLFRCYSESNVSDYEPELRGNSIRFIPPANGYIYTAKVVFNYTETTDGNTRNKQISWYIRSNYSQNPNTSDPNSGITFLMEDNIFYNNLQALINTSTDKPTTTRKAGVVQTIVTAGTETLDTYYQVNNAYSVFSQTRPEFDNVSNGSGLVASRTQKVVNASLTLNAETKLKTEYPNLKFQ